MADKEAETQEVEPDVTVLDEGGEEIDFALSIADETTAEDVTDVPGIELDNEPAAGAGDSEESEPESVPEGGEDKEPQKPEWDKYRQAKDQEIATLRKQNVQLTDALATKGKGEGEAEVPADDILDLDSELPELDEFADEDARNERINLLIRRDKARGARDKNREEADQQRGNKEAYDAILDECDKQFGPELRNDAVAKVKEIWDEAGFGPGNYPDAASTRIAVRGVYAELENVRLREGKPKPKPKKTSSPKPDTGRGGNAAPKVSSGMMTVDEAADAMRAEGKTAWAD